MPDRRNFQTDDRFVDTNSSAEYKGQSSLIESTMRYKRTVNKNRTADLQCSDLLVSHALIFRRLIASSYSW